MRLLRSVRFLHYAALRSEWKKARLVGIEETRATENPGKAKPEFKI